MDAMVCGVRLIDVTRDSPFTPVFIPLSPCWVTGLSVTLMGADRTPVLVMEPLILG